MLSRQEVPIEPSVGSSGLIQRLREAGCVYAEEEAAAIMARFSDPVVREDAARRRCAGAPLEHVLGEADFAGVRVQVVAPVFIPRHRAESLVDVADSLTVGVERLIALDLGCGSGAIAAVLAHRHPGWEVHATDADADAVACARANAQHFGFHVHLGDWFGSLPQELLGRLDLVVAHLPYVPSGDLGLLPRDFRNAERAESVDGGRDGLDPWRAVTADAPRWLRPAGRLLTQATHDQSARAMEIGRTAELGMSTVETEDAVVLVATSHV